MRKFTSSGFPLTGFDEAFSSSLEKLCEWCDTPYALSVWLRYMDDNIADIIKYPPATDELQPTDFSRNWGLYSLFKKYNHPLKEFDPVAAAISKAVESEDRCRETNNRFILRKFSLREEQLLSVAARKIESIIGRFPPNDILSNGGWGPGATASIARKWSQLDNKLLEPKLTVTSGAQSLFLGELARDNLWLAARDIEISGPVCILPTETRIIDFNRMALVPKSAKTLRSICAEPTGNLFLQKSVGSFIRRKLLRVGIDLDNQGVNQKLAQKALHGLSTLDLASASDSMSIELVRDLLPFKWFCLLDALRCPSTRWPDGTVKKNDKFSSMGNGFTFELETLIFYALASAVDQSADVAVYGDDIIVNRESYDEVVSLLYTCGFVVNSDKSFPFGLFYESCGKHYLGKWDITPPSQERFKDLTPFDLIRFHNRIYRWMMRISDKAQLSVLRPIRKLIKIYQPDYIEGDFGLLTPDFQPSYNSHGWLRLQGLIPSSLTRRGHQYAMYAYHMRFFNGIPGVDRPDLVANGLFPLVDYKLRKLDLPPPNYCISSIVKRRIQTLLRCG